MTKIPYKLEEIQTVLLRSMAADLYEIEHHLHNREQIYGLTANAMARKSVSPIVVTGGSDAWGTELLLTNGTVIESGDSTKKFDLGKIAVTAVGTANRVTVLEFYETTAAAKITSVTTTDAGDLFTKASSGLVNGDKVILSDIVGTTGINTYTVYYIISVAGNNFQVSLTLGGAAVVITTNGTCSVQKLTQTLLTETVVSRTAAATDSLYIELKVPRVSCNSMLTCRGYAAGGTNAISFFISLHTYTS